METLAKEIVSFMIKYGDTYELRDCYESVEEFVTETIAALYDKVKRHIMALVLKEYIEWSDCEEEATEAAVLYRKVMAI